MLASQPRGRPVSRTGIGVGVALAALVAGGVEAAPRSNWTAQASKADLDAAEATVRDRSVGGRAVMQCAVEDDGSLSKCRVVRETPQGSGYGEAALSLAPKYRRKPPGKTGAREAIVPVDWYRFDTPPDWLKRPTPDSLRGVFPRQAVNKGVDGSAVISCIATVQGALQDCYVMDETPPGLGFGGAALALTPQLMFKPARLNGVPVVSMVNVPINWEGMSGMERIMLGKRVLPPNLAWTTAPTFADVAAAYPARAKAERRGGRATVACSMSEAGALINCREVSSEPGNYGFGAAAKTLAKGFSLAVTTEADRKATRNVSVHLPFVFDPQMLETAAPIVGKPHWATTPSAADVVKAFGELKIDRTARVQLDCAVKAGGGVEDCKVVSEEPEASGVGQAALALAGSFRLTTWTTEGLPTVGGRVRIPLRYEPGSQPAVAAASK
jgi:TonB family protein